MDLIKKQLDSLKRGHCTTMFGLVVLRIGERYVWGETVNFRATGEPIDDAARGIYDFCRNRDRD